MTRPTGRPAPPVDVEPEELLGLALTAASAGADVALRWARRLDELTVETKESVGDLVSRADREAESAILAVLNAARPDDLVLAEESGASGASADGVTWVVDPIDGTSNFLYGADQWAVSVAAVRTRAASPGGSGHALGEPLAGVVLEPASGRASAAVRGGGVTLDGKPVRVREEATLPTSLVEFELGPARSRELVGDLVTSLVPRVRDVRRRATAASSLAAVATGRLDAFWAPSLRWWDVAAGWLLVQEAGGLVGDLDGPATALPADRGACLVAAPAVFEPLRVLLREVYSADTGGTSDLGSPGRLVNTR